MKDDGRQKTKEGREMMDDRKKDDGERSPKTKKIRIKVQG